MLTRKIQKKKEKKRVFIKIHDNDGMNILMQENDSHYFIL